MIGPETSFIACTVASCGFRPASMLRSTFSTTTMASSTTMPIASTRPNSDSVLIEKPQASITANVPTTDTGTAKSGITEARHVCRNTMTTSATSTTASISVWITESIDSRTNWVGSYTMLYSTPSGKSFDNSFILARTSLESCSAFAFGAWKIGIATADWLSSSARRAYEFEPISRRATSFSSVVAPSALVLMTMLPNSSTDCSRPCVLTVSWKSAPLDGPWPTTPAATCTFCSRIAFTTSLAVRLRAATFCGSSQTRMA